MRKPVDWLLGNKQGDPPTAPLHLQPCFAYLGYKEGDFPVSERVAKTSLALPVYPELQRDDLEYVAGQISEFFAGA